MRSRVVPADAQGVAEAAKLLLAGGVVAFPTETVYGLGGLADEPGAVAAIFAAKGRPPINPLIVHVLDEAAARALVDWTPAAGALAASFWPGPLTLVLPRRPEAEVAPAVCAGLPTLAVRVPAHPVARALLAAVGRPIAAPSANPSGRLSPTRAEHVAGGLALPLVLEGGPAEVGLESTVLDLSGPRPVLLRPGGVTREAIERVVGPILVSDGDPDRPTAPGQLLRHYAPRARLRLEADAPRPGEAWLGFGGIPEGTHPALDLSPSGDLDEAAAALFGALHVLDAAGCPWIAVAPIPERGVGVAINERLRRAAASTD